MKEEGSCNLKKNLNLHLALAARESGDIDEAKSTIRTDLNTHKISKNPTHRRL